MPSNVPYNSEEERREAKIKAVKRWRAANLEKAREADRLRKKQRRAANPQYLESQMLKKSYRISKWKTRGIIHDDWESLYITYLAHSNCMDCDCELTLESIRTETTKCLDHDHETGEVRAIVCHGCNVRRGVADRARLSSQEGELV